MRHVLRMLLAGSLFAVGALPATAQKVGTTSLQFLKVMPGARATAMGDAYVSLADGADAVFWNPAGLGRIEEQQISSTYISWLMDTKLVAISYGMPVGDWGNLGVQFQYVDYGSMEETRADAIDLVIPPQGEPFFNPGLTGRSFNPYAYGVGLSFARAFTDRFAAGATVKYMMESLWADQVVTLVNATTGERSTYKTYANVMLYDFGMLYRTGYRSIQIGVAVQNFGPQVIFANEARPAPLAFRMGVSADLLGPDALLFVDETHRLTVAYDLFQPNDYQQQMHVGAEYVFASVAALRAGYKVQYDTEGLTFGGGIRTTVAGAALSFDYSYGRLSEYLNDVHRISLGVQLR